MPMKRKIKPLLTLILVIRNMTNNTMYIAQELNTFAFAIIL